MKTRSKALLLALCAVMLVCVSVMGTVAYLTSTDSVENTFTVGSVKITMDEAKVNEDGTEVENADRVKTNKYHLLPGHSYTKDPTIHVDAESEDCWLFVKLEDGLTAIQDTETVLTQMGKNGWTLVEGTTNIYAYKDVATAETKDYVVFGSFKIKGDVDNDTLAEYKDKTIVVTAYAVQKDGFDSAAAAWTATYGAPANNG